MHVKQIGTSPDTFMIVFETGDELASGLTRFAKDHRLQSASFQAVGGLSSVRLAWFNWETKTYDVCVALDEQVELLSMIGDVALNGDDPVVHAHVVIGRRDGTAHGGHLQRAIVRPTCEVVLIASPVRLQKARDAESGLLLIRADVSPPDGLPSG